MVEWVEHQAAVLGKSDSKPTVSPTQFAGYVPLFNYKKKYFKLWSLRHTYSGNLVWMDIQTCCKWTLWWQRPMVQCVRKEAREKPCGNATNVNSHTEMGSGLIFLAMTAGIGEIWHIVDAVVKGRKVHLRSVEIFVLWWDWEACRHWLESVDTREV